MTRHSTAARWKTPAGMLVAMLLLGSSSASAASITFDFEQLANQQSPGIVAIASGLTLTVTRVDGANLAIQDLNGVSTQVSDFGHRTMSNFLGSSNATSAQATLILSFSAPISSASISFGDLGGAFAHDDDSPFVLTAFSGLNATGANLASTSVAYPADLGFLDQGNGAIRTAMVNAAGIRSLTVSSGGPSPGTLYYDNIVVDTATVPEPAALLLLTTGLAGVLTSRRTRRQ
jgi:hypothetical protein